MWSGSKIIAEDLTGEDLSDVLELHSDASAWWVLPRDADYGAVPFDEWTALGTEKLIYYEGHHNTIATRIVSADGEGLTFTVNGKINYLIVAPVGIDIEKYADDEVPGKSPKQ